MALGFAGVLVLALGQLPLSSLLGLAALPIFLALHQLQYAPNIHAGGLYVIDRATQAAILAGLLWMLAMCDHGHGGIADWGLALVVGSKVPSLQWVQSKNGRIDPQGILSIWRLSAEIWP